MTDETFEGLCAYWQPRVYNFIFARLKDSDAADDVTAQTFLKAYDNLSRYDETRAAFSTWLFTIALNELRMYVRQAWRRHEQTWEEFFEPKTEETPEAAFLRMEKQEELLLALDKLTERERRVIELRYWSDMPYRDIADMLDITTSNVGVIINRALTKLRKILVKA